MRVKKPSINPSWSIFRSLDLSASFSCQPRDFGAHSVGCWMIVADTPWKINMEPTNHPFGKGHDLLNLHD